MGYMMNKCLDAVQTYINAGFQGAFQCIGLPKQADKEPANVLFGMPNYGPSSIETSNRPGKGVSALLLLSTKPTP